MKKKSPVDKPEATRDRVTPITAPTPAAPSGPTENRAAPTAMEKFETLLGTKIKKSALSSTKSIRQTVSRIDPNIKAKSIEGQVQKIIELLKHQDKDLIIREILLEYFADEELKPYQAELIKLQRHLEQHDMKMIVLFDGRDASGKGGTIRRVTRYMNEKHCRVVALGKPSSEQKSELHIKRYIQQFPHAGEIVLFDRSWYNRAMVETVMGFCSDAQYKRFMKKVVIYEKNFLDDGGKTFLLKLYFSVSKEEQRLRFERRKNDPLRQWKLSEVDLQAQALWDEFSAKKFLLLKKTHTPETPWHIIRSDDKHLARLETIKLILSSVRYRGRNRKLDYAANPDVVIPGDQELKKMQEEYRQFGKFMR